MKIGKRLIAFMLVILTLATVSINSINLAYADGGAGDGAGNISGTGGSKSGTWSSDRTGIRVYVVDKSGNLMSNIVDIISDTKMPQYKTAACFGTRGIGHTQIYNAGSIKANQRYDSTANIVGGKNTQVIITTADDVGLTENGMPIQDYKNKVFTTSGETLKNYMLGSSGNLWQGGNSGGGGGTTGNVEEDNNIGEAVNSLTAALQSRVDAYTKAGYEHSVIVVMIGEDITNITNDLVSATNSVGEPMFSKDEISVMVSAMYDFKKRYEAGQTQTMGMDLPNNLLTASSVIDVAYADENTDGVQLSPLYDDGYLIDLMDFVIPNTTVSLFAFNSASGIKQEDWAINPSTGKSSFITTCAQHGYIVFMEPLFYSRLNDRNGYASTFMFYGTISNYGKFINDKNLNQGWSNGDDVGGNLDRALHKSLAWSMYTENDLQLEGKAPIIRGTKHPNFNDEIPNGNLNNSQWWGFGLHYYILSAGESSTHTYDSHNYPITDPGPHGDNPNYKEHPAPDPSKDPCTSTTVEKNKDKAHYRIVKVYDQEVLYASIDENGELNLTKGTEHVSTHVREQTLPKIEVQDEMPEYKLVEWKYTYDQYVPVTEGGTESTKWEDEPIAGRTVVNSDIAA